MYVRRLVKTGSASHTVSLPKEWIEKNKLNKGDLLHINEDNNNLVIKLSDDKKINTVKEISFSIDNKDIGLLRRETISAYMNNHTKFIFLGKTLNKRLAEIRSLLQNFLALEIVEQTETKLVVKDFLNLKEFSIDNTIRRMDMLTRSMLTDCKLGKEESESLKFRDFEVDKLFFLISRLIRSHLEQPFAEMSNTKAMATWWLAKNFESIADQAKSLCEEFPKEIEPMFQKVQDYYIECAKSYFKKDKELANQLIENRIDLLDECDKLKTINKEKLKLIIKHSRNIAKIILDS